MNSDSGRQVLASEAPPEAPSEAPPDYLLPFVKKLSRNELLVDSYSRLGYRRKAQRVSDCGHFLTFDESVSPVALVGSNFCKIRLCPMCAWRRSRKIFGQISANADYCTAHFPDLRHVFFTLTIRNVGGEDLSVTLDKLSRAWHNLSRRFLAPFVGTIRVLEITFNQQTREFHPHFHVIGAVKPSYFSAGSPDFISTFDLADKWGAALGVDYSPICDMRACDEGTHLEMSKYVAKDSEFLIQGNPDLTDFSVLCLTRSLANRRLISYSGAYAEANRELNHDDPIDGDLTDCASIPLSPEVRHLITSYRWSAGAYKMNFPPREMGDAEFQETFHMKHSASKKAQKTT